MPTTPEQVREALKDVQDPELMMGIIDLGLIYAIDVTGAENENVAVTMTFTSPMCPVGPMFVHNVRSKVESIEGVRSVKVDVTFTPPWDPRTMASEDAKFELGIWDGEAPGSLQANVPEHVRQVEQLIGAGDELRDM